MCEEDVGPVGVGLSDLVIPFRYLFLTSSVLDLSQQPICPLPFVHNSSHPYVILPFANKLRLLPLLLNIIIIPGKYTTMQ